MLIFNILFICIIIIMDWKLFKKNNKMKIFLNQNENLDVFVENINRSNTFNEFLMKLQPLFHRTNNDFDKPNEKYSKSTSVSKWIHFYTNEEIANSTWLKYWKNLKILYWKWKIVDLENPSDDIIDIVKKWENSWDNNKLLNELEKKWYIGFNFIWEVVIWSWQNLLNELELKIIWLRQKLLINENIDDDILKEMLKKDNFDDFMKNLEKNWKIVYHWTNNNFEKFELWHKTSSWEWSGFFWEDKLWIWLTNDKSIASKFWKNIIRSYITIKNIKIYDDLDWKDSFEKMMDEKDKFVPHAKTKEIKNFHQAKKDLSLEKQNRYNQLKDILEYDWLYWENLKEYNQLVEEIKDNMTIYETWKDRWFYEIKWQDNFTFDFIKDLKDNWFNWILLKNTTWDWSWIENNQYVIFEPQYVKTENELKNIFFEIKENLKNQNNYFN